MSYFTKGVSRSRLAALTFALGVSSLPEAGRPDSLGSAMEDALSSISHVSPSIDLQSFSAALRERHEADAGQPLDDLMCSNRRDASLEKIHGAILSIVSILEDGSLLFGTGTIIQGSGAGGPDRILTTAHVLDTRTSGAVDLLTIDTLAFDADGRLAARVTPLLVAEADPQVETFDIARDIAVLQVETLIGSSVGQWNERGLPLAGKMSGAIDFLVPEQGGALFSHGMSGAPIVDSQGGIRGILSLVSMWETSLLPVREDGHLSTLAQSAGAAGATELASIFQSIGDELRETGEARVIESYGASLSITQQDILDALEHSDAAIDLIDEVTPAFIAGFPGYECLSGAVRAIPTPWAVPREPGARWQLTDGPVAFQ